MRLKSTIQAPKDEMCEVCSLHCSSEKPRSLVRETGASGLLLAEKRLCLRSRAKDRMNGEMSPLSARSASIPFFANVMMPRRSTRAERNTHGLCWVSRCSACRLRRRYRFAARTCDWQRVRQHWQDLALRGVSAHQSACLRLGPDPRRALGPAATSAAQAGHVTAPDQCCSKVKKSLPGAVHT